MIKWEQLAMEGNLQFGVQLQPMDFVLYAQTAGRPGTPWRSERDRGHFLQAFTHSGSVVIQAVVDPL
jgi:thiamine pyrophosphate-dependent acetolactate synthase large subunit-like protein